MSGASRDQEAAVEVPVSGDLSSPRTLPRWWRAALAMTAMIAAAGCASEARTAGCPPGCASDDDPTRPCIVVVGCRDSSECPAGTICVLPTTEELATDLGVYAEHIRKEPRTTGNWYRVCREGRCLELTRSTRACVVPPEGSSALRSRHALIDGFGVDAYHLERITPADDTPRVFPVFEWVQPPEGLRVISCALFGCEPEIRDGRIVNYAQCVIARKISEPPDSVVDLASMDGPCTDDYASRHSSRSSCRTAFDQPRPPLLTALLLGCWAYDDAGIVAATYLEPVAPGEFPGAGDFVVSVCGPADAGKSCLLDGGSGFGMCACDGPASECCAFRCIHDAGCALELPPLPPPDSADAGPVAAADGGDTADAGESGGGACERAPDSFVGYCRRVTGAAIGGAEVPAP